MSTQVRLRTECFVCAFECDYWGTVSLHIETLFDRNDNRCAKPSLRFDPPAGWAQSHYHDKHLCPSCYRSLDKAKLPNWKVNDD